MAPGVDGSSTAESSAFTLGDEIAEFMGDFSGGEVGAVPGDDAHPTPEEPSARAASAASTDQTATPTEPTPDAEHAGEPPAVAATDGAASDDDPLAGAAPATYTVDGQARTYDGLQVLKGGGAIVEPEKLPDLLKRLSERDHLFERDRATYGKLQDYERLSAWTTKNDKGETVTVSGIDGMQGRAVTTARLSAAFKTLTDAIASDDAFRALVDIVQGPDGQPMIVRNTAAFELLRERADNAAYRSEQETRARFSVASSPSAAPAAAETPIAEIALPTVEQYATAYGIAGLTAEDKTFLAGLVPRYVQTTDGKRAVDPAFLDVMRDRAALRASTQASAKAVADAATTNAARLAGALAGKRPAARATAPTAPTADTKPGQSRAELEAAMWDRTQRIAAGR